MYSASKQIEKGLVSFFFNFKENSNTNLGIVSQQLSRRGNFVMKTFKWYGPYSFGADIPKMNVYISVTVAGRNYDVIKNGG